MTISSSVGMTIGGPWRTRPRQARAGRLVRRLVQREPEPSQPPQHARTDLRAALADAGGEHHAVDAAHARRQRAGRAAPRDRRNTPPPVSPAAPRSPAACACRWTRPTAPSIRIPRTGNALPDRRSSPFCCCSHRITPASSEPERVPIGSPSNAVNPMEESTLRPPASAHIDAPDPRCATTTRPGAISGASFRQRTGDVFVRQAVKAVAPHAFLIQRVGDGETVGHRGMAAMERGVEARYLRHAGKPLGQRAQHRHRRRVVQRRQRIQRLDPRQRRAHPPRTGAVMSGPPCTTRWPNAARPCARQRPVGQRRQASSAVGVIRRVQRRIVHRLAVRRGRAAGGALPPIPSTSPSLDLAQPALDAIDAEFQAGRAGVQHAQATICSVGTHVLVGLSSASGACSDHTMTDARRDSTMTTPSSASPNRSAGWKTRGC